MFKTLVRKGALALMLGALTLASAHAQVNKCTVDGQVIYQSEPCVGKGVSGKELKIQNTAVSVPAAPVSKIEPPPGKPTPTPAPISVASSQEPASKPKTQLEREADMCLAWYKPKLRDPKGAYYSDLSKDNRVLSMSLHATNVYGGYTVSTVACEINNGSLDEGWTKIHAERAKW